MVSNQPSKDLPFQKQGLADAATDSNLAPPSKESGWKKFFGGKARQGSQQTEGSETSTDGEEDIKAPIEKWSLGVLNDKFTDEVPGTFDLILLFTLAVFDSIFSARQRKECEQRALT